MNLHQVIELDNGNYRIEADLGEAELIFLIGVAFAYLLKAGSTEFVTKVLGEKGSVSVIPQAPKLIQ
jgi:hypothetical protein